MGIARRMHHDFDVLIQRHQRLYQPFQRNALELVATHLRHLRLGHAGDRRRFGLAELALVEQLVELERERGLRRQFFGVLETRSSNTLSVLSGWSIRVIEFSRSPRSGRALLCKRSINPARQDGIYFQEAGAEAGEQFQGSSAS